MKVDFKNNEVIFSNGRKEYANNGILGISEGYDDIFGKITVEVSEGYDGGFGGFCEQIFTKEEKRELADWAIELWNRWVEQK